MLAVFPAPSVAVTVIGLEPVFNPTVEMLQLVVPTAVPEPPVEGLAQVTLASPDAPASEAVPDMDTVELFVMKVEPAVGVLMLMEGA